MRGMGGALTVVFQKELSASERCKSSPSSQRRKGRQRRRSRRRRLPAEAPSPTAPNFTPPCSRLSAAQGFQCAARPGLAYLLAGRTAQRPACQQQGPGPAQQTPAAAQHAADCLGSVSERAGTRRSPALRAAPPTRLQPKAAIVYMASTHSYAMTRTDRSALRMRPAGQAGLYARQQVGARNGNSGLSKATVGRVEQQRGVTVLAGALTELAVVLEQAPTLCRVAPAG